MAVTASDNYCYVYGIVPANLELPGDLTGLDDQAVSLVSAGKLAAVVSRIDLETTGERRERLARDLARKLDERGYGYGNN